MAAGPGLFSRSTIRFIEPSFVFWRRPIVRDAHCLGTFLIARLLLASPGSSDSLRILVFAHAGLRATNPPAADQFRSLSSRQAEFPFVAHNCFLERRIISRGCLLSERGIPHENNGYRISYSYGFIADRDAGASTE